MFGVLGTQWRMGPGGRTGLDYAAIPPTLELLRIPPQDWPDLFTDLRTIEGAVLKHMKDS